MYRSKITRKENTKFLGIFLDQNLSWKVHANFVVGKLTRIIGIIQKINENLTLSTLKTLYFSFFQPSLQYGIFFWYFVSSDLRNRVFRLQKKALRLINRKSRYTSTHTLFQQNKILKFQELYELEACKFIHQDVTYTNNFSLISNSMIHDYPTRSNSDLRPPFYRTLIGTNFVLSRGVNIYNNLDENLKMIDDLNKFKCKLKLFLLSTYE